MNRLHRVLAVAAPVLGLGCWTVLNQGASVVPTHRIHDPDSPWYGRSRDLPASGPVIAPEGAVNELAIPLHRLQQLMPGPQPYERKKAPQVAAMPS